MGDGYTQCFEKKLLQILRGKHFFTENFIFFQMNVMPCNYSNCLMSTSKALTAVSGVGLSPALATCETSQVLLAGVPCGFSRGSPVFAHLLVGPSHMS